MFLAELTQTWVDEALCKDLPQRMFFPERHESAEPALRICRRCPVREECLEYAMRNQIHWGIWGGTSERERRRMRRRR
jgi:WhiB family redox-sensing transcriptional regulator